MQQNQLMKKTAFYTFLFTICSLAAILYYSANKVVVVADLAQDEVVERSETGRQESSDGGIREEKELLFVQNGQDMNYFCIPLQENVKAENVTIENHYMDKELWVSLRQPELKAGFSDFYRQQGVYGKRDEVSAGYFEEGADTFWLKFQLTALYEYHSILEDSKLYIEFVAPKEAYDKIVVIDPAYGGEITGAVSGKLEGKDITLDIARALKRKLDDTDIKVYYTRMDDSAPSEESRVELANAVKADMMIRIEVNENEDTKIYGTEAVYNSKFFIPGFGSVELADMLEREVVTAISGKANGLVDAEAEDTVICDATVPAAAIRVGYVSNGQEAILLNRDDYIQKIADGIYQAILAAYDL